MMSPGQVQLPISQSNYHHGHLLPRAMSQTTVETLSGITQITHIAPENDKTTAGISDANATDGFRSEHMLIPTDAHSQQSQSSSVILINQGVTRDIPNVMTSMNVRNDGEQSLETLTPDIIPPVIPPPAYDTNTYLQPDGGGYNNSSLIYRDNQYQYRRSSAPTNFYKSNKNLKRKFQNRRSSDNLLDYHSSIHAVHKIENSSIDDIDIDIDIDIDTTIDDEKFQLDGPRDNHSHTSYDNLNGSNSSSSSNSSSGSSTDQDEDEEDEDEPTMT